MSNPTDQIAGIAGRLEAATTATVQVRDERATTALAELMRRTRHVVRCAAIASATPDGYPTKTPGASDPVEQWRPCPQPGCANWRPCPEHDVTLNSVEQAVTARAHTPTDEISKLAKDLMGHLRIATEALEAARHDLDRFDALRNAAVIPEPPMCYLAARYGLPWDTQWEPYRATDFRNVIDEPFDEPRRVSNFVYWFVYNNRHLRRCPTKQEMLRHLERDTVKVRAA